MMDSLTIAAPANTAAPGKPAHGSAHGDEYTIVMGLPSGTYRMNRRAELFAEMEHARRV